MSLYQIWIYLSTFLSFVNFKNYTLKRYIEELVYYLEMIARNDEYNR